MKTLYKAKFLGQGFAIDTGTIVDVVAEKENDVLFFYKDYIGWHVPKHMIEKIEEVKDE